MNAPASEQTSRPTKEQVRRWLTQRMARSEPLPGIEQIQRTLGWKPAPDMYAGRSKTEQQRENEMIESFSEV